MSLRASAPDIPDGEEDTGNNRFIEARSLCFHAHPDTVPPPQGVRRTTVRAIPTVPPLRCHPANVDSPPATSLSNTSFTDEPVASLRETIPRLVLTLPHEELNDNQEKDEPNDKQETQDEVEEHEPANSVIRRSQWQGDLHEFIINSAVYSFRMMIVAEVCYTAFLCGSTVHNGYQVVRGMRTLLTCLHGCAPRREDSSLLTSLPTLLSSAKKISRSSLVAGRSVLDVQQRLASSSSPQWHLLQRWMHAILRHVQRSRSIPTGEDHKVLPQQEASSTEDVSSPSPLVFRTRSAVASEEILRRRPILYPNSSAVDAQQFFTLLDDSPRQCGASPPDQTNPVRHNTTDKYLSVLSGTTVAGCVVRKLYKFAQKKTRKVLGSPLVYSTVNGNYPQNSPCRPESNHESFTSCPGSGLPRDADSLHPSMGSALLRQEEPPEREEGEVAEGRRPNANGAEGHFQSLPPAGQDVDEREKWSKRRSQEREHKATSLSERSQQARAKNTNTKDERVTEPSEKFEFDPFARDCKGEGEGSLRPLLPPTTSRRTTTPRRATAPLSDATRQDMRWGQMEAEEKEDPFASSCFSFSSTMLHPPSSLTFSASRTSPQWSPLPRLCTEENNTNEERASARLTAEESACDSMESSATRRGLTHSCDTTTSSRAAASPHLTSHYTVWKAGKSMGRWMTKNLEKNLPRRRRVYARMDLQFGAEHMTASPPPSS